MIESIYPVEFVVVKREEKLFPSQIFFQTRTFYLALIFLLFPNGLDKLVKWIRGYCGHSKYNCEKVYCIREADWLPK